MSDFVEKIILDDSQAKKTIEELIKDYQRLEEEINDTNKAMQEGSVNSADANKKHSEALRKTAEEQRKAAKETEDHVKNIKILGVSYNDVVGKLKIYQNGLLTSIRSTKDIIKLNRTQLKGVATLTNAVGGGRMAFVLMAKSVNLVKAALISSGIGIAVVAIGSLVAAVSASQKGMDKLGQATAYVGGGFDVLKDKAAAVGNELIDAFEKNGIVGVVQDLGDKTFGFFKKVFTGEIVDDIRDTAIEMKRVASANAKITKQLQEVQKAENKLNVERALSKATIKELNLIGEDTTKGYNERKDAIQQTLDLERKTLEEELRIAERRKALIEEQNSLTESTEADNKKVYDLEVQISNLKAASLELQVTQNNKLNTLNKEYENRLKASLQRLKAINKEVVDLGVNTKLISEQDAFEFAKENQIEQLQNLKKELKEIAKITGKDVKNEVEILDQAIEGLSKREFIPNVTELPNKIKGAFEKVESTSVDAEIEINAEIIPPEIDPTPLLDGINNFEDLLSSAIDEIFSSEKSKKAASGFITGLKETFSTFNEIANEATNIQIGNIDKQLEKLTEKREELEDGLDREIELNEKGLSNNLDSKQKEIDEILKEEERLNKEKEKLNKEAQKRQLIIDSVTQGTSLITSSINIIKGFSQIPIIGLPLGIAAVASLLTFFAKTKADAFKATRLYTGAKKINDHFGFADRHGDTDLIGQGDGYELVNKRTGKPTNTVISGKEMLIPEDISLANESFFDNLRLGFYNGLDLTAAMGHYLNFKDDQPLKSTTMGNKPLIMKKQNNSSLSWVPFITKDGSSGAQLVNTKGKKEGSRIIFDL